MESATNKEQILALTPNAVKEIKSIIQKKNLGNVALRVGVQGGGCSGLSYNLNFETEAAPHDASFEMEGLRVIVDEKSALYLAGTTLDFSAELVGGGFKFHNPNAKRSCGCGESFSA
ncbi:MAG TPA: iron-sulfur cluster assembly accessory protein [Candidatus Manganitrophaceae bacterium]|nr:iron-sulfur cluster assembly accessory protein [Candidatus Manganitrophaceae bacterium]